MPVKYQLFDFKSNNTVPRIRLLNIILIHIAIWINRVTILYCDIWPLHSWGGMNLTSTSMAILVMFLLWIIKLHKKDIFIRYSCIAAYAEKYYCKKIIQKIVICVQLRVFYSILFKFTKKSYSLHIV